MNKSNAPKGKTVKKTFKMILWAIRMPLFLLMSWLRAPVVFVCNIISVPALLISIFAWYAYPEKMHMAYGIAALSFIAFFIRFAYGYVLSVLSPVDTFMEL